MKKLIFIFFLMPVLGFAQPVTDGLVGYWPFNGNANDESGNGNDGAVNGATLTSDRFGNANSAYEFDGVDDYIRIPNPYYDFNTNEITISIWLNYESFQIGGGLGQSGENSRNWSKTVWGIYGYPEGYGPPGNNFKFVVSNGSNSSLFCKSDSFPSLTWIHLTFRYDNNEMVIFVNGYKEASNIVGSTIMVNNPNSIIHIGKDSRYSDNRWYKGKFDDIAIFNRALTEQEIQSLYTSEAPAPPSALCNTLYCDGQNIGIGTSDTPGYKLAVAGNIISEKVKVAAQTNWPDYVFEEEYNLQGLQQLEQYIKQHGHLPNIPDAETINEGGLDLGEMNAKLLEKIEELSLYIIEQEKRIKNQQEELNKQKSINKAQEEKFQYLEERLKKLENH